jgi:transcriptional regulator with XRE-family HTH domain
MKIPEKIKILRMSLHESQSVFAKRFGVSHVAVSGWESGKSVAPYKVIEMIINLEEQPDISNYINYGFNKCLEELSIFIKQNYKLNKPYEKT